MCSLYSTLRYFLSPIPIGGAPGNWFLRCFYKKRVTARQSGQVERCMLLVHLYTAHVRQRDLDSATGSRSLNGETHAS